MGSFDFKKLLLCKYMYIHDVWGENMHATVIVDFRGQPCGVISRDHTQVAKSALSASKILVLMKFDCPGFFS